MAPKKPVTHHKREEKTHAAPKVAHIPDVFDEEGEAVRAIAPVSIEVEATVDTTVVPQVQVPVETRGEELPAPRPPRIVTEITTEEVIPTSADLQPETASPSFTVRQNGMTVEQKLPAFFVGAEQPPVAAPESTEDVAPDMRPATQTTEEKVLEAVVPQAFVGEVSEVAREVKQERKGTLVTFFIIIGMLLVAGGAVGLYVLSTKKTTQTVAPAPTPQATPVVQATPVPTPTVIVNTATGSAAVTPGGKPSEAVTKLKVNVLNGTSVKGLAAKEAALLKKAGYTLGTVGNGKPDLAGTITVPTGSAPIAEGIKSVLTNFTFTVTEDPKAKGITVTLGDPQ